ncbi:MAG: hypothetical protein F4Y28_00825, partial [Acidimicrobiia bacterium]|nr:hypothetical protein [Acidimicrobiia bacterium]
MRRALSVVLALVLTAGAASPVGASAPVDQGCVEALAVWGSVDSSWTTGGCRSSDLSDRYARFFTFSLDRETAMRIGFESTAQRPALYLYRGHDLQSAQEIGYSQWAIRKTLPVGDYMIEATTWFPWRTGAFTLAVGEDLDPVPAVTINGGIGPYVVGSASVTEGRSAVFTLSASPPPSMMLPVSVWVTQNGDLGVVERIEEVIIPSSGSATLTVATVDDDVDERRGWVEVGIRLHESYPYWHSGHGTHDVVYVYDNDPPRPPPPPPPATGSVVSVAAGSGVTEGGDASFTVTASPAPSQPLTVDLTVSQVGDHGAATGSRTVTIPTSGSATVTVSTSDDEVDEPGGSVSVSVDSGSGYTVSSTQGSAAVGVADDDAPAACPTVAALAVQARANHDALPDTSGNWLERNRWWQTWIALSFATGTHNRQAWAAEARIWELDDARWTPFAEAMECLESVPPWGGPVVSVAAGGSVTEGGDASFTVTASPAPSQPLRVRLTVGQWGRFGVPTGSRTVMVPTSGSATVTVSTSDDEVDEPDGSASVTVDSGDGYNVSALDGTAIVDVADDDISEPAVSVTAGAGVVEGASAQFTVTASPVPPHPLTVNLDVGQVGDFGVSTGSRTVTVPTSGSATVTVGTSGDSVSEADGSVVAEVQAGTGYTLSFPRRATVAVSDDDGPFVPPEISITAGADVTEGGAATFTVSASPAPVADIDVAVTVTQSGDFGVAEGSRAVTVPTSGSVDFSVSTSDDSATELHGSVTAKVQSGYGYTASATDGSASVSVTDDDDAPDDACAAALSGSGTVGASWHSSCVSVARKGRFARFFTFSLDAQATVRIDLTSHWDNYLYLRSGLNSRASGVVAHTSHGGPGLNARIVRTLDAGDYTIEATTYWAKRSGTFTLTTTGIPDQTSTREISITADGDVTEGTDAAFSVAASPAPSQPLSVDLTVGQVGDFGASTGSRTVTVGTSGTATVRVSTSDDDVDESDGSVSVSVDAGSGYTVSATAGSASVVVADDDDPPPAGCGSADALAAQARANHDALANTAANRKERNDWWRAWIALSGTTGTYNTPLTAAEALVLESGDARWTPFRAALECVEGTPPAGCGSADALAAQARAKHDALANTAANRKERNDWWRAWIALSGTTGTYNTPLTVAEALVLESGDARWTPFRAALECLEGTPPPATPEISVTAGSGVVEGSDASFTVTADPAPTQPLSVNVTVSQSGDFGATTGSRTVTVPTSGTATLTVATTDDDADEPDGSVTVTVAGGSGYTVSGTAGSATVNVADDDDPPPAVPEISITADGDVTEGADASFTVTADPAPSAPLQVGVSVAQSGDYGATTGSRTVTVPTSGSATVAVSTTDDDADEADGSVSVTVSSGSGYTVSSAAGSASVAVADDDDPPPAVPVVSVAAGSGITEGGDASFTVTADPAPSAPLQVGVSVAQSGDYGATTGSRTVTVPTSGSATVAVSTTDDDADEADGSVSVTVSSGSGYTVSGSQGSASVVVADDDDPPPVVPVVSVTAGSGSTEGGDATFTVTADPAPAQPLTVDVTVSQSGDFGASTGSRTVTVPTSGTATLTVATTDDD